VLVGAGLVATRPLLELAGPASLAFLRYAIGAALLTPVALVHARAGVARCDLLPVAALGVGQFGILIVLLNWSLETITSGRAALLFATMPVMSLVLAVALGREGFSRMKLAGVFAAVGGVAVVLGEGGLAAGTATGGGNPAWIGDAAALASALVGAVCSVLYRPYLDRYPTLAVSAVAMLAAAAFLGAPALGEGLPEALLGFGPAAWLAVGFVGVSSGVGYLCWLFALGRASPTRVTVFLALSPLTAIALGGLALGERVTAGLPAGAALVALGLWLTNRQGAGVAKR
jgi:drug/metabolite transporter (DMT)-like permease